MELHPLEKKVLNALIEEYQSIGMLSGAANLSEIETYRALQWLKNRCVENENETRET